MWRLLFAISMAGTCAGNSLAQVPDEHKLPMASFGGPFTDPHGLIANQRQEQGPPWPWIGLQYVDNGYGKPVVNDTNEYWRGYYENGEPSGTWLHHRPDGSFSLGSYVCSDWYTFTDTEGQDHTGCHRYYIKDGVWHYYDRDSTLVRTERYSRYFKHEVCGIDSFFFVDTTGKEILINYNWRKDTQWTSHFFRQYARTLDDDGHLLSCSEWNFWKNRYTEYFPSGLPKRTVKYYTLLGFRINRMVVADYSEDGKNKVRRVERAYEKSNQRIV